MLQRLKYRLRYWWRAFNRSLGICERCGSLLNYTTLRRGICPNCGR